MKKDVLFCVILCFSLLSLNAQQHHETYKLSGHIASEIEKDTVSWKYQTGAAQYSFIGDYKNTLITWDKAVPPRTYVPTATDSVILENSQIHNAGDYIVKRSAEERIVIINEAHQNPRHRVFTRSLLEGLYKNGYRYLGLEAVSDTLVNTRRYAVETSGFYTKEPEFGNLIHEAIRIGFTVFGYEATEGKNGKDREIEQARNIEAFMSAHPEGKYFIHCGFDHVYEKEVRNWGKAMAGRLKEYTGIDPLTVDQVKFSEKSTKETGHYFLYATKEKESFVLTDRNGTAFNGLSEPRQTDICVIHPVTDYKYGRPQWLTTGRQAYWPDIKKDTKQSYPVQVLAYRTGEYGYEGIPSDLIEITSEHDQKPLYLQKGQYKIIFRNSTYTVMDTYDISVTD